MVNEQVVRMEGYDVVIAGAGTTSCILAKVLAERGKKVIVLEEGDDSRKFLNGTIFSMMLGGHQKKTSFVGCSTREGETVLIALGLGGGSKTYGGLAVRPDYDWWRSFGIDLEPYREWAEKETWVAEIPKEFIGPGEELYAEAADKVGFPMEINYKHVNFDRCLPRGCAVCAYGCPQKAKYDATYSAQDAMKLGAKYVWHVTVTEPIIENGKAVGFRGKRKDGVTVEARGKVAVASAGGFGNVALARKAGLEKAGTTFAGDASVLSWGILPQGVQGNQIDHPMVYGMEYKPTHTYFGSCMHTRLGWLGASIPVDGLSVLKYGLSYKRLFVSFAKTKDDALGHVYDDGTMSKTYSKADEERLDFARDVNKKICLAAGCAPESISHNSVILAHPSATVKVGESVDSHLEAKTVKNLFFCDTSVFPESLGAPTVLTLAHLAKYEGEYLASIV